MEDEGRVLECNGIIHDRSAEEAATSSHLSFYGMTILVFIVLQFL
jgi:hypothetical protein